MHIIVFLLSMMLSCVSFAQQDSETPPVDMQLVKLTPHVWYVKGQAGIATDNHGFISNSAVIETEDEAIVFDALGTPALAQMLLDLIRQKINKPVKRVYVSHYHADHVFGLQVFKQIGAEIMGPEGAQQYIFSTGAENRLNERRESLKPWVNKDTRLIEPDSYIKQDQTVRAGKLDIQIITFGAAHSHADLALYIEQDQVLLSGDLIFVGRIPFVGGNEIARWIEKLDQLESIPAKWIVPGHGEAFQDKPKGMALTRDYLTLLQQSMQHAVGEMLSFDEAYKAVDWSRFASLPAFDRGNRGNAYRIFLSMEASSLDH